MPILAKRRGSTVRQPSTTNSRTHNAKERAQFVTALKVIVKSLLEGGMTKVDVIDTVKSL